MGKLPTFDIEQYYWDRGYELVIGIDEVGRGAFAGPVVVGAVAFAPQNQNSKFKDQSSQCGFLDIQTCGIDDSKRLNAKQREQLEPFIKNHALCWSLGIVDVPVINRVGIGKATNMAMRKAVRQIANYKMANGKMLKNPPFLLIDAFNLRHVPGIGMKNQLAIVKGDQKSLSIAAASIIAKVYRDALMNTLGSDFSHYYWGKNKGYGTLSHRNAITTYGKCKHHREQFIETWFIKSKVQSSNNKSSSKNPIPIVTSSI